MTNSLCFMLSPQIRLIFVNDFEPGRKATLDGFASLGLATKNFSSRTFGKLPGLYSGLSPCHVRTSLL